MYSSAWVNLRPISRGRGPVLGGGFGRQAQGRPQHRFEDLFHRHRPPPASSSNSCSSARCSSRSGPKRRLNNASISPLLEPCIIDRDQVDPGLARRSPNEAPANPSSAMAFSAASRYRGRGSCLDNSKHLINVRFKRTFNIGTPRPAVNMVAGCARPRSPPSRAPETPG